MSDDEATANNESRPAVGAPVQPSVRPLVERLRDGTYYGVQDLFDEAADEIQRLRGIVPDELERLNDELCAENERLRKFLGAARDEFLRFGHDGSASALDAVLKA